MQYMYAALWPTLRVTQHWQANAFTSFIVVFHSIGVEVLHTIGKPTCLPLSLRSCTPLASQRVYLFHCLPHATTGALYFFVKLPPGFEDDVGANQWLVKHAGVCLVPGSPCYAPGKGNIGQMQQMRSRYFSWHY